MKIKEQYMMIKHLNLMLSKGYGLLESLHLMTPYKKIGTKIIKSLEDGQLLSSILKKLGFKDFVSHMLFIGEQSNKMIEVLKLIETQFEFHIKMNTQFNKVILYPFCLFMFSLISFEIIRINIFPMMTSLLRDFNIKQNEIIIFLAFHSLKIIMLIILSMIFIYYLYKSSSNVISYVKLYHSIYISNNLTLLLSCGYSLEAAIELFQKSIDRKLYKHTHLESYLFSALKPSLFSCSHQSLLDYIDLGIKSNQLCTTLKDYSEFYLDILMSKLTRLSYYIQFSIFIILCVNIFLLYYIMMIPMLNVTENM